MTSVLRILTLTCGAAFIGLSLQGCVVAAGAAGAAGGYEAHKHGYEVQSPVKKDEAGGYKAQPPVTHDPGQDQES